MPSDLKNAYISDLKPLLLGTLVVLVSAGAVQLFSPTKSSLTIGLAIFPILFITATAFYSLKSQIYLGGEVGHNLAFIATGLSLYGVVFHLINIPYQIAGAPVIYGLSSSFWLTSTHSLQIFGIIIATYGFYRMWRSSQ